MGRKSLKDSRRQEIIAAFYEVARHIGLENASIAKVADHMNINPSLILHYFKTKDELYKGLIRYILQEYNAIYERRGAREIKSYGALKLLIHDLFSRKWNDLIDDGVFYSCYAQVYRNQTVKDAFRVLHDALRSHLVDVLQDARRKEIIAVENVKDTTEIIFALLEGAYYYLGMVGDEKVYNRKLRLFRQHALSLLSAEVTVPV